MSDRHSQDCAPVFVAIGEHRVGRLDPQPDPLADVLEARVAQERAGQQSRLAGDLKSVADRRAPGRRVFANAITSCMIGLNRAIAPARR